jgi:hypothetical protein
MINPKPVLKPQTEVSSTPEQSQKTQMIIAIQQMVEVPAELI